MKTDIKLCVKSNSMIKKKAKKWIYIYIYTRVTNGSTDDVAAFKESHNEPRANESGGSGDADGGRRIKCHVVFCGFFDELIKMRVGMCYYR